MAEARNIKVKLIADTSEYEAAMRRIRAELESLPSVKIKVERVEEDKPE